MTYQECRDILFDCHDSDSFTREWCEQTIIESEANRGKGIPARTWQALFNNHLLVQNEDNTYSFVEQAPKKPKASKGERQKHGFNFESMVKEKYNILPCPDDYYTHQWDGMLNGIPVSIKTEQLGSDIEMASFERNAQHSNTFYLIVGFWENDKENIVTTEILLIDGNEWHQLFNEDIVNECHNFLANITNDYSDDERWALGCKELKEKWQTHTSNLIRPRFKRDHKKQKRMQCAINYTDFYKYFIPRYKKEI
jgi:hypothetical protein